jgi:hypothetical protein
VDLDKPWLEAHRQALGRLRFAKKALAGQIAVCERHPGKAAEVAKVPPLACALREARDNYAGLQQPTVVVEFDSYDIARSAHESEAESITGLLGRPQGP